MTRTDIDALHAVVTGQVSHRGCGKTFAKCHEVAAAIALEERLVVCCLDYFGDSVHASWMIIGILEEWGLREYAFVHGGRRLRCGPTEVVFVAYDEYLEKTRCAGDHIIVDMGRDVPGGFNDD